MINLRILAVAIVAVFAAAVNASTIPANGPVIIVDGDTIKIDGTRVRLLDIDAPETYRSRCENELVLGLKAKARLRELVDGGPVAYEPHGHDRYGRTLAHVLAGGTNVGDVLLAEGLALRYQPGPEAKQERLRTWCGTAEAK